MATKSGELSGVCTEDRALRTARSLPGFDTTQLDERLRIAIKKGDKKGPIQEKKNKKIEVSIQESNSLSCSRSSRLSERGGRRALKTRKRSMSGPVHTRRKTFAYGKG